MFVIDHRQFMFGLSVDCDGQLAKTLRIKPVFVLVSFEFDVENSV